MALNDFANSPPPTGTPLSIVNQANPGASYFAPASGGGGGGAGPNLSVSTLSFPSGDEVSQGVINMSTVLSINDPTTAVVQDFKFVTNDSYNALSSFMTSTINDFYVNGPGGDGANGQLLLAAGPDGRAVIWCNNAASLNSTLSIVADNVIIPSNIQVSSINGAVPGGAISTFDSISLNSISSIGSEVVIGQNLAVANVIACSGISTVSVTPLNSGDPVTISSLAVSTVNGAALPIAQGDGYNVAPWQASGIIVGSQGIFSGVLNLGGNLSGGNWASTIQLPPFINWVAPNNMTGNVVSGAYGSGGLTNTAIQFPTPSTMSVSAEVAGTIGTLFISVQGSATGFL